MNGDQERLPAPAETGLAEVSDTSFEIELDDAPAPSREPVFVDTATARVDERKPIVPAQWRGAANVRASVKYEAGRLGYIAGYHGLRLLPIYTPQALFWAVIGVFRIILRQLRWWWLNEAYLLEQAAASRNDKDAGKDWRQTHEQAKNTRRFRGVVLGGQLVAVTVGVVAVVHATLWIQVAAAVIVVPLLAHFGRPVDRPIVSPAVVTARHRRLNSDVVLRAYYAAGLGHPDKPDQQIGFASTMARDPLQTGSHVVVDMPHGVTFSNAMNAREKLASGLDVSLSQVYLTRDKSSNRRHMLWVADVDPLSIPAGPTPLLDCKVRDIWRPAPLGVDERGRRVLLPMVFSSILVGAQPRKGKTFSARALGLFAALDPHVRLSVFDGKGSPDWRKFALVAHTYGFGLLPDRIQGEPIENLRTTLRAAKRDVLERNAKLSELPTTICPEGKLTREISRDRRFGMPVWLIILDEFQEYLNTGDEEADREIAELLVFLVKVGPSVGVILISSTQRPSGIGSTGKVAKLFTDFRDNHLTRFALKTGSWQVSDLVLGSGAYSEGFDSSALPVGDEYRGIGILYDAPVDNATVRTYLADGGDAEKILLAARRHREQAGMLDGMAAGEQVAQQARDPLADVLDSYGGDETFLSWATLAGRLAEQLPERYAGVTPNALSNTITGLRLGVESKAGAEKGGGEARPRGAYRAQLERAMTRRDAESK